MGDLGEGGVAARVVLPTGVAVLFRFGMGSVVVVPSCCLNLTQLLWCCDCVRVAAAAGRLFYF